MLLPHDLRQPAFRLSLQLAVVANHLDRLASNAKKRRLSATSLLFEEDAATIREAVVLFREIADKARFDASNITLSEDMKRALLALGYVRWKGPREIAREDEVPLAQLHALGLADRDGADEGDFYRLSPNGARVIMFLLQERLDAQVGRNPEGGDDLSAPSRSDEHAVRSEAEDAPND